MEGLQCRGCGSGNVVFDPRTRILKCNTCGKEEFYSRATLNKNGKVVFCKENAMNFFFEGKIDNAQRFALDILNISRDNTPAMFIIAYHEECVIKREGALRNFFNNVQEIPLEYDEVRDLIKLFKAAAVNLANHEDRMIRLLAANMQAREDVAELSEFIDAVCPSYIAHQPSSNYLTPEKAEMYKDLSGHCDIPKTCLALVKAITDNPDSPYFGNTFYLKAKAKYFFEHVVLPIGEIINNMKQSEYKQKFVSSYAKRKAQYEQDMAN